MLLEGIHYLLLPGVTDIPIRIKQRSNVHCLSAPNVSVNSPIECKFQRPPIERSGGKVRIQGVAAYGRWFAANLHDSVGGHGSVYVDLVSLKLMNGRGGAND